MLMIINLKTHKMKTRKTIIIYLIIFTILAIIIISKKNASWQSSFGNIQNTVVDNFEPKLYNDIIKLIDPSRHNDTNFIYHYLDEFDSICITSSISNPVVFKRDFPKFYDQFIWVTNNKQIWNSIDSIDILEHCRILILFKNNKSFAIRIIPVCWKNRFYFYFNGLQVRSPFMNSLMLRNKTIFNVKIRYTKEFGYRILLD